MPRCAHRAVRGLRAPSKGHRSPSAPPARWPLTVIPGLHPVQLVQLRVGLAERPQLRLSEQGLQEGEGTSGSWRGVGVPRAPLGLILPPPACAYLVHQLHPVRRDLLLPALAVGRSGVSPRWVAKVGARSGCPRPPTWSRRASPCAPRWSSSTPKPTTLPLHQPRSKVRAGRGLSCILHPAELRQACPASPRRRPSSPFRRAPPAMPHPPSPAGTGSFGCRGWNGGAARCRGWNGGPARRRGAGSGQAELHWGCGRGLGASRAADPRGPSSGQAHAASPCAATKCHRGVPSSVPSPRRESRGARGSAYRLQAAHRAPR